MVEKKRKLVAPGLLLAVTMVVLLCWFLKGETYEARCVYAHWKSNIDTNSVGEVVQPELGRHVGSYADYLRVAEERLSEFFTERAGTESLFLDYVNSSASLSHCDIASVSNAFASIRFAVTGDTVAVVELTSKSESKDLALDVLRFTLQRYLAFIEDKDRRREEKALAMIKNDIERKRCSGEDDSSLVAQLKEAEISILKFRQKITIVRPPYIVRK